jgi:hypothetical protein
MQIDTEQVDHFSILMDEIMGIALRIELKLDKLIKSVN